MLQKENNVQIYSFKQSASLHSKKKVTATKI